MNAACCELTLNRMGSGQSTLALGGGDRLWQPIVPKSLTGCDFRRDDR